MLTPREFAELGQSTQAADGPSSSQFECHQVGVKTNGPSFSQLEWHQDGVKTSITCDALHLERRSLTRQVVPAILSFTKEIKLPLKQSGQLLIRRGKDDLPISSNNHLS
jgi:hypothetical protein